MPNACAAPNCYVGYEKISDENKKVSRFHFPLDIDLRTRWINAVPRKDWSPSKNSVLCEKHFLPSDFKTEREDKNKARKKSNGKSSISKIAQTNSYTISMARVPFTNVKETTFFWANLSLK